jgi:hypothetical protein
MKKLFLLFIAILIFGCENEVDPTPNFKASENLNGRWEIWGLTEDSIAIYEVQITTGQNSLKIDSLTFKGEDQDLPIMYGTYFGEFANNWFKGERTFDTTKNEINVLITNDKNDLDFQIQRVNYSGLKKLFYYSGRKKN